MIYDKAHTAEIIFPLGGIGSGSIGLMGNGHFTDWEIFGRPDKGSANGYTHIAIAAEWAGHKVVKVLQGDWQKELVGRYGGRDFSGYGFGPDYGTMAGYDHFREWEFEGDFPFCHIRFSDPDFPGTVRLSAYNPMIPGDVQSSVIPGAFFSISIENTAEEEVKYRTAFSLQNPFERSLNAALPGGNGIFLSNAAAANEAIGYGDMTITGEGSGADAQITTQVYWYRGGWQDSVSTFWREFAGCLTPRQYAEPGRGDVGTVMVEESCSAKASVEHTYLLTWNVPNMYNYWNPCKDESGKDRTWKHYYATLWQDSRSANAFGRANWDTLRKRTEAFTRAVSDTTVADPVILDAAVNSLEVLHSPTVLLLEDGTFYGWEGCRGTDGSCEGSCTHVWNYAYALCYLFPSLERSMREMDFTQNLQENGAMRFRLPLPVGRNSGWLMPCVDGQMGGIIKLYRDWKLSGDDAWLKKLWPLARKSLEFAWSEENPLRWDPEASGVLTGRQHHTLDMELYGPSGWLQSLYLGALQAAAQIAAYLGEVDHAAKYREILKKGARWTDENLFNGEYYIQKIDLGDQSLLTPFASGNDLSTLNGSELLATYWNPETEEIKYQIGEGCEIDQLLGEWHMSLLGLPGILEKSHVDQALTSLYRYNFKPTFRGFTNTWRNFVLNDEAGTIMCAYPDHVKRPSIPIPYPDEVMTGFEYALAGLFLAKGRTEEALNMIHGIRDRYDGAKRNPFNEIECGSHYARSMAAFALLPISAGFSADLPNHTLHFAPLTTARPYQTFWSVEGAWGTFSLDEKNEMKFTIVEGSLPVDTICIYDQEYKIR